MDIEDSEDSEDIVDIVDIVDIESIKGINPIKDEGERYMFPAFTTVVCRDWALPPQWHGQKAETKGR